MPKMIQLRNVPDALHKQLKARAALEGKSLSDYLIDLAKRSTERPTLADLRKRLSERSAVTPPESPADAVRAERDRR